MQVSNLIKRPKLRSIENTQIERHASWLELFFDLIFVLAVAQVAQSLNQDFTLTGVLRYLALFAPVWWAWIGYSFYADRFESDEVIFRVLMFAGMMAMAAVAINVRGAFNGHDVSFAIAYVVVRLILIGLYVRAAYHVPLARQLCIRYIIGFGLGNLLWMISIFVPSPAHYWFWGMGFVAEVATAFVNLAVAKRTPYDASHIPERFGLFNLIVIGEAILTGVTGIHGTDWHLLSALIATGSFAIAAAVWWLYYDFVETYGIRKGWVLAGQVYMYAHFTISAGIAAIGVSTQHAINEAHLSFLSTVTRWVLCGSVALFLLSITAIRISVHSHHLLWARLSAIVMALSLAGFGEWLPPLLLIAVLLSTLIGLIVIESVKQEAAMEVCELEHGSPDGKCSHIGLAQNPTPKSIGCEECIAGHYQWVHLRMCLICGHVGCCDSSKFRHATKHFEETGHPIMKSIEPDENWSWCYIDETYI
ncbi:MAG: low temperature requirement protein A [Acidobacteriota bacterium]